MSRQEVIYRHSGTVRLTHWVNVVALLALLMSGLQIFNAHPATYPDFLSPLRAGNMCLRNQIKVAYVDLMRRATPVPGSEETKERAEGCRVQANDRKP